jgi:hypothetical protein
MALTLSFSHPMDWVGLDWIGLRWIGSNLAVGDWFRTITCLVSNEYLQFWSNLLNEKIGYIHTLGVVVSWTSHKYGIVCAFEFEYSLVMPR